MLPDAPRARAALLTLLQARYPEGLTAARAAQEFEGLSVEQARTDLLWLAQRGYLTVVPVARHRSRPPTHVHVYTAKVPR